MTAVQSNLSLSEIQGKVFDLTRRLYTIRDLGRLFSEDDSFSVPAAVMVDYAEICLPLIEEVADYLSLY